MRDGIAIAIAWPETNCKKAGAWYDLPMAWLGINKGNYYKVGHAAAILIEKASGSCFYFDFGRYHSPYKHGRVRSVLTDHELEITTKAVFDEGGKLSNFQEIVLELFQNESNHGTGYIIASYCDINFTAAYRKALQLQEMSPIPYGPFLPTGTNCSRFVNKVIVSGEPNWIHRLLLLAPKTLTPTPIGNVKALNNCITLCYSAEMQQTKPTPISILSNI